jgi:hypothetical protein
VTLVGTGAAVAIWAGLISYGENAEPAFAGGEEPALTSWTSLLGAALRTMLMRSGAIEAARARAVEIVEDAKRGLPATRRTHSRELLLELADRVVARDS